MSDREQFLEAFLKCEANLRAFIGVLVRNHQDRNDVFQETALTLWQKYDEFDPNGSFAAWSRGVAAKKVLQCRTRSGRIPTPFSPETISAICDAIARHEAGRPEWSDAVEALEKCVEMMPEDSRRLLNLRYAEGWSVLQIAGQVGRSSDALTMAFSRIRARLHDCVQERLARTTERNR